MTVIGLAGGSGSGKSSVALIFEKLGVPFVDADKLYWHLTSYKSECVLELTSEFGEKILNRDGSLNRAALREMVFGDENREKLNTLNRISHKHVIALAKKEMKSLEERGAEFVLFDAPLLFESGFHNECDFIIAVVSDAETRIKRITARDSISRELAILRIRAQITDDFLRDNADFIIENNGSLHLLEGEVLRVFELIKNNDRR